MTRAEIEAVIVSELSAITDAAITIYGDEIKGNDAASDIICMLLEKEHNEIEAIINGGYIRYYAVKALIFKRNRESENKSKQANKYDIAQININQYFTTASDKTYIYTSSELDQLNHAITQLPFIEQKVVYHYMAAGSMNKLVKQIADATDGKGIPLGTIKKIMKSAKQKIKTIIEDGKK